MHLLSLRLSRVIVLTISLLLSSIPTIANSQKSQEPPWLCDTIEIKKSTVDQYTIKNIDPSNKLQQEAFTQLLYGFARLPNKDFEKIKFFQDKDKRIHICLAELRPEGGKREIVVDVEGHIFKQQGNKIKFLNDPNDPWAVRDRCSASINTCIEKQISREGVSRIDQCVATTQDCPELCRKRYKEARERRIDPMTAVSQILYEPPSCVPGMDECLKGKCPQR